MEARRVPPAVEAGLAEAASAGGAARGAEVILAARLGARTVEDAVFAEDAKIKTGVAVCLWKATSKTHQATRISEARLRRSLSVLLKRSLVLGSMSTGISLHGGSKLWIFSGVSDVEFHQIFLAISVLVAILLTSCVHCKGNLFRTYWWE